MEGFANKVETFAILPLVTKELGRWSSSQTDLAFSPEGWQLHWSKIPQIIYLDLELQLEFCGDEIQRWHLLDSLLARSVEARSFGYHCAILIGAQFWRWDHEFEM